MMYGNCTPKKELLQFIDQVSFAIDDLLLFLDTHPKEKRALEYYSELSARRNELLEKYAKFYGPLTIDTGNDSDLKSWQWMEQPFPWEQEGGCRYGMWNYEKRLQYPVNIKTPNAKLAQFISSKYGGPECNSR